MSLKVKIILGVTLIEAVLLLLLILSTFQYMKSNNRETLENYIATTKTLLVTTTKNAIISFDLASLDTYIEEILSNKNIAYIKIFDHSNNNLAEGGDETLLERTFTLDNNYDDVNDSIYDTFASVDIDSFNYGKIEIGFKTKSFEETLSKTLQLAGIIAAIEMLLIILFSCLLGSVLTKQLKILRNAAKSIRKGDYSRLIKINSTDEIGDVAITFNSMITNLRSSEEKSVKYQMELLELNKNLEKRVNRRTEKINAQKDKLESAYQKLSITKKQLIHSEKMASIGQLAAGVAHEINNPIAFVKGNLNSLKHYIKTYQNLLKPYDNLLKNILSADKPSAKINIGEIKKLYSEEDIDFINEDIESLLNESIEGTSRVQEIVKGLKTYSYSSEDVMEPADINSCLEDTLKMLNNEIKYKCDVVTNLKTLPPLSCNKGKIIQVFTNLIVNASHAITEHGTLTVSTQLMTDVTPNTIQISIQDTGTGIAPENIPKLFDPFFTTKEVGKGTGLGLSISHGIIEDHHGRMEVVSTVGAGTTFVIHLPIEDE